jgi:transposase
MDDTRYRQFFLDADPTTYHRRYEALRAVFVDGLSQDEVAARSGFTYGSMRQLIHGFRAAMRSGSPPPFFKRPSPAGHPASAATTT